MSEPSNEELYEAVMNFFTSPVDLPRAPDGIIVGEIWWEDRGNGWLYPWRMTSPKAGYPCGDPRKEGESHE